MSRKVEHILRAELGSMPLPEPRAEHLTETATLSLAAYRSRRPLRRIGVPEMVVSQIRFIAAPIWALQAAVVLCICLLLHLASAAENLKADGPALLSMSSVFVAMSVLPFHGRSRRFKMREIEGVTRASHGKLMLAKLSAVGLGDAICLAVISQVSAGLLAGAVGLVLSSIVLPFLLCCTGILLILDRARGGRGCSPRWASASVSRWDTACCRRSLAPSLPGRARASPQPPACSSRSCWPSSAAGC